MRYDKYGLSELDTSRPTFFRLGSSVAQERCGAGIHVIRSVVEKRKEAVLYL